MELKVGKPAEVKSDLCFFFISTGQTDNQGEPLYPMLALRLSVFRWQYHHNG